MNDWKTMLPDSNNDEKMGYPPENVFMPKAENIINKKKEREDPEKGA